MGQLGERANTAIRHANTVIKNHRPLSAFILFSLLTTSGLLVVSHLIGIDVFHRTDSWRPFDLHPVAMAVGTIILFASLLALLRAGSWNSSRAMSTAALSATAVVSSSLCVAATFPGAGSIAIRDVVSPEAEVSSPAPFGYAVLFSNGSSTLAKGEVASLVRQIQIFKECATTQIELRGFASSAAFKSQSDTKNFELANKRAFEVQKVLSLQGLKSDVHVWYDYTQMTGLRRVVDVDPQQGRRLEDEARNRRVEVLWHGSPCASI
jgi:hypothetical protein